jgi:site-specific DNA-methyltransferase (adenine-specific)
MVIKNSVLIGSCETVLKTLPDESIDCIVTDPPYGISFMGKEWDKALPSLEALKECNRVLKAGAFGFFMCAPRMDVLWRMGQRLEEAGFRVDFSFIGWATAQGFPKSMSISKAIDKRNGRKPEEYKALGNYLKIQRELKGLTQKDIAIHFPSKTGGLTGCYWNWENSANVPTLEQWGILKELLNLDSRFDELIEREEAEREVIGKQSGFKSGHGVSYGKYGGWASNIVDITIPATDQAKQFNGAYASFQPKPALEVIITVMKPLECKTYVDQALQNGKGVTWLGDCKIPYKDESDIWKDHEASGFSKVKFFGNQDTVIKKSADNSGRFPANLLVSDNVLDRGIKHKATARPNVEGKIYDKSMHDEKGWNYGKRDSSKWFGYSDSGDFSRYFSLDAWFDKKLQELPPEQQKTFPFLITPKPSKSEKNRYIENKHPTVKPLKLMSYLITMGSREGDVILDPYAGSGTTLEACRLLNRSFIGIDEDTENEKYMVARGQLTTLQDFETKSVTNEI